MHPFLKTSALIALPASLLLVACKPESSSSQTTAPKTETSLPLPAETSATTALQSVVRINATQQTWSAGQPWEKQEPRSRRSLGALIDGNKVLTTAETVADWTFLEFETTDGRKRAAAKVVAVDYEANLALVSLLDDKKDADFFTGMKPLQLSERCKVGSSVDILQVEDSGLPIVTTGPIQTVDVISSFLPEEYFLTYEAKCSMQGAASSFSLPVLKGGKLLGLLTTYSSKDQLCDIVATDIVARFVKEAGDGQYDGFPELGIATSNTDDSTLRDWLKLPAGTGGVYVTSVSKNSPAQKAGLQKGDVISAIDGHSIDQLGYYEDEFYGRLFWSHLVRGAKSSGDTAKVDLVRDGKPLTLEVKLERHNQSDNLVPAYTFGQAPHYLVKGGMIFQELTRPLLEAFGDDWESRAPLDLLDALENPERYENRADRIVFLSGVIPTPATVGYESLRNLIVTKVNGKDIRNMKDLIEAMKTPDFSTGLHSIEFEDRTFPIYLDEKTSSLVDKQLLKRGLPRLSRASD
jgi:S1-C subfamily serine protease